jgi:putative inorganic carbon (HCO3(-)) transporter
MNAFWQHLTLMTLPLQQWQAASYLSFPIGRLRSWRKGSRLMQHTDAIGAGLVALVFVLAPFLPNNDLIGVLLAACGGYWLLLTLSDEVEPTTESTVQFQPRSGLTTPIHWLVLLYWGILTVATALSPVKQAAFSGWIKLTLYLLFFALAARVLRSPKVRNFVITSYLLTALAVSVYGLQQWFSGTKALATWVDPESTLSTTTRVYSYLGNPNLLAGYLVPAVILSLVAIVVWQGWLPKALAVTMTIVNAMCLSLTLSRGGWIGLAAATLALVALLAHWWSLALPKFWQTWGVPLVLGGMVSVLLLAIVVVEPLQERVRSIFSGTEDSSNRFRITVWQSVLQMIRDRPVLGIGPGNAAFNNIYPKYQRPRFSALSAYSIVLEVAVEAGIIGLICFLWLLLVTFNLGVSQVNRLRQSGDRTGFWLLAAIATLLGMFSHGLFDTILYRPQASTLWWLMIALIASYHQPLPQQPVPSLSDPSRADDLWAN